MDRRSFLKVGALFVPAVVAPRVAYSFLRPALPLATYNGIPFPQSIVVQSRSVADFIALLATYEKNGWVIALPSGVTARLVP